MKYLYLVWKSMWRKKARTVLTLLSIFVAFLLFGLLSALNHAFTGGADLANAQRLVTLDKISIINSLPGSYLNKIRAMPGVERVAGQSWFGGYYQEPRNQFPQYPVDPADYLAVYPEFVMPEEQKQRWFRIQDGVIVGKEIAEQYGFGIGDRIPVYSSIWTNKSGEQVWDFEVTGIFEHEDPRQSAPFMLMHYKYFDEGRAFGNGTIGWFTLKVADGADPVAVAAAVDAQFANSANETKTSTEAAFAESFTQQFGNIALIVTLILAAVFFTILLVAGNTMAQSVRERISELAVLKTLGFDDRSVLGIVLFESILLMVAGGALGLAIAWVLLTFAIDGGAMFPAGLYIPPGSLLSGVAYMVGAGVIAGIFPALSAMRLSIVDALART